MDAKSIKQGGTAGIVNMSCPGSKAGMGFFCCIGNFIYYTAKPSKGSVIRAKGIWMLMQPRSGARVWLAGFFVSLEEVRR